MSSLKLATILSLLAAGQTAAQSRVAYELELAGDNHGTGCESPWILEFTPGSTFDGQVFPMGSDITWAVRLEASGIQQSGDGAGYPIYGVADFTFDLELYKDAMAPENLVAGAIFYSSVNDGSGGCPTTSAAFAYSYDCWCSPDPGRVIDSCLDGGPNLAAYLYPFCPGDGTLLGMGAAYAYWDRDGGCDTFCTPGVGMEMLPDSQPGLGVVPVCEGQIDTATLESGTYILKLVPGGGTKVLRGDVDLTVDQEAFATSAEQVTGDTITFMIAFADCQITGWSSVRTHGAVGELEIALNPSAPGGIAVTSEPRQGGLRKIAVDFDGDVSAYYTPGQVSFGCGCATVTGEALVHDGTRLEIDIGGSVNQAICEIDLSGSVGCLIGDTDCMVAIVEGDVNNDHMFNLLDLAMLKGYMGMEPRDNPRCDLNTDGYIDCRDLGLVPFEVLAWTSVRTHGDAGELAIELDPTDGEATSETRRDGLQKIAVDFDGDVSADYTPGQVSFDCGSATVTGEALVDDGRRLEIDIAGSVDEACCLIDVGASVSCLIGDTDCMVSVLAGDTNGDGYANLIDMAQTKSKNGSDPTVPGNARFDVNVDGNINLIDMALVKSLNGHSASCP